MSSLAHLRKDPRPAPSWIHVFMAAVEADGLDREAAPSRRAALIAEELVPASKSPDRSTWVRRFAILLDREPLRLDELERQVSPGGPVEQIADALALRVDRAMKGLS